MQEMCGDNDVLENNQENLQKFGHDFNKGNINPNNVIISSLFSPSTSKV